MSKMETLTVLCVPISAVGHMNASLGVANALRSRGHKVVFVVERSWQGNYAKRGFDEELFDEKPEVDTIGGVQWNEFVVKMSETIKKPPLEGYPIVIGFLEKFLDQAKHSNAQIENIVKKWKPNVIIEDRIFVPMPALVSSDAPLIKMFSISPLYALGDENLPSAFLGLPLNDKSDWERSRKITQEMRKNVVKKVNEWLEEVDSSIPKIDVKREYLSTNLNIFMYPKGAADDYLKQCPLSEDWMRLDFSLREASGSFVIPPELKKRDGKLILFSLGSIGTSLVELMKRLMNFFSKSKHSFIVSKGLCGDQYELSDNMWGQPFIPQLDILPHVDLVITHGGNNTFTESLYFGKPMIVFPLFGDQHDNAQRAVEMKIAFKFNPFLVEENELNEAIETLLFDSNVTERVQKISKEMQQNNCMDQVVERIEYVAKHPKFPTITGVLN